MRRLPFPIGRRIASVVVDKGDDGQPHTVIGLTESAEDEIVTILGGCLVVGALLAAVLALIIGTVALAALTEIGGGE